jgi:hypothetical protein
MNSLSFLTATAEEVLLLSRWVADKSDGDITLAGWRQLGICAGEAAPQ